MAPFPGAREELIARMALRDDVGDPGAAREAEARIDQLLADPIKNEADRAELLPAVERAKRESGRKKGLCPRQPPQLNGDRGAEDRWQRKG